VITAGTSAKIGRVEGFGSLDNFKPTRKIHFSKPRRQRGRQRLALQPRSSRRRFSVMRFTVQHRGGKLHAVK
jgi:ketosteroid isomerase-like protein